MKSLFLYYQNIPGIYYQNSSILFYMYKFHIPIESLMENNMYSLFLDISREYNARPNKKYY